MTALLTVILGVLGGTMHAQSNEIPALRVTVIDRLGDTITISARGTTELNTFRFENNTCDPVKILSLSFEQRGTGRAEDITSLWFEKDGQKNNLAFNGEYWTWKGEFTLSAQSHQDWVLVVELNAPSGKVYTFNLKKMDNTPVAKGVQIQFCHTSTFRTSGCSTSVEVVQDETKIWGSAGTLYVSVQGPQNLQVYNATGRLVFQGTISGEWQKTFSREIYFVKAGENPAKKIVL